MSGTPTIEIEWIEVGPRDGLQSWPATLPTPAKVGLITNLLECGFHRVEATSMVHPKWVPQLADAEAVLTALLDRLDRLRVLVPNQRGFDRAMQAGVRNVAVTVAATDSYNRHNLNRSVDETLKEIAGLASAAQRDKVVVDASISVAFGCPYDGAVSPERVAEVASRLEAGGIAEITLADTIGVANPAQVESLFQVVREQLPAVRWGAHFHDTRGTAMANLLSALETGVSRFEGSVGGIGGSPFAPGAAGNLCSEDALTMLEAMGVGTGIAVNRLIDVARGLERTLGGPLPGKVHAIQRSEAGSVRA
jgi:hydroxymethylglutaryl-CoA lyase